MIVRGHSYLDNTPVEIHVEGEQIHRIAPSQEKIDSDLWIGPGFTDLQVNGYGGLDYNECYPDPLKLGGIARLLYNEGVTSHYPTIITNSSEQITRLIHQVITLRKQDEYSDWCIEGLHIEGPFISAVDGPRGAHPKAYIRPPDWDLLMRWQEAAEGSIKIITLSPEWENATSFIERCVKDGIHVFIGHTCATHQQLLDAVSAGASLSTHLGNGMHPIIVRHPNYLWSQLADDRLGATIIADGFHLPAEVIHVFHKVKKDKLMLVSDSVSLAGMPPGDYDLHIGGEVTLTREGKLHLRNNPAIFAGSASNIRQGVSFLIQEQLTSLNEAWEMASVRPEKIMNPQRPVFASGAPADLICLKKSGSHLEMVKTIKKGKLIYAG